MSRGQSNQISFDTIDDSAFRFSQYADIIETKPQKKRKQQPAAQPASTQNQAAKRVKGSSSSHPLPATTTQHQNNKAKTTGGSASSWYEQMVGKLQPSTSNDASIDDQSPTTTASSTILLSERPDLWNAAQDALKLKQSNSSGSKQRLTARQRATARALELEGQDDDENEDFLVGLMKNRTGDAFDDLLQQIDVNELENAAELKRQQLASQQQLGSFDPYVSNPSAIGVSTSYDNYHAALPHWVSSPQYQTELARMIKEHNSGIMYTKLTPEQIASFSTQVADVINVVDDKSSDDEDDAEDDDDDIDLLALKNKQTTSGSSSLLLLKKNTTVAPVAQPVVTRSKPYTRQDYPELIARCSHQVLILPTPDARIEALNQYHEHLLAQEDHCRVKSKMVVFVKDGRAANLLITRIGTKVTKHIKNNRGVSNAGLTVSTKGVEMVHDRQDDDQRAAALKRFASGAATTLIITDAFAAQLWPLRHSIGIVIHFDVPQVEGTVLEGTSKANLTANEIQARQDEIDQIIKTTTIVRMGERLSYVGRLQNKFPEVCYVDSWNKYNADPSNCAVNAQGLPELTNKSLVMLSRSAKSSHLFAKFMAPIYQQEYGAQQSALALQSLADSHFE